MLWNQFTDIDQGLEKIPEYFKEQAWSTIKQKLSKNHNLGYQELFNEYYHCLKKHENLSVSSQAEAYRLFAAAQIKNRLFLLPKEEYNWSDLARGLIDNLKDSFQNHSRPILTSEQAGSSNNLELILSYYFPDPKSQNNLEQALKNKLEKTKTMEKQKEPKLIGQRELAKNPKLERKLIQEFLDYKIGRHKKPPSLSRKILVILETYFTENKHKLSSSSSPKEYQIDSFDNFEQDPTPVEQTKQSEEPSTDFSNYNWS